MESLEIPSSPEDKEALDSIVLNYLRDVDTELAANFRRLSKARSLGKNGISLAKLYQHYKNTVPESERVRNKVKRQHPDLLQMQNKETAAGFSTRIATPDVLLDVNDNTKVNNEVIDLTYVDIEEPAPKMRRTHNEISSISSHDSSLLFQSTYKQSVKSMESGPSTSKAIDPDVSSYNLQNSNDADVIIIESLINKTHADENQQPIKNEYKSQSDLINFNASPDENLQIFKDELESDHVNTSSVALKALADIQEANKLQTKILGVIMQYTKQLNVLNNRLHTSAITLPQKTDSVENSASKSTNEIKIEDVSRDIVNSIQSNDAVISESPTNFHNHSTTSGATTNTTMNSVVQSMFGDIKPQELINKIIMDATAIPLDRSPPIGNTIEWNDTEELEIAPNITMAINDQNVVTFKSNDNAPYTGINIVATATTDKITSNNIVTSNISKNLNSTETAEAGVVGEDEMSRSNDIILKSTNLTPAKNKQHSIPINNANTTRRVVRKKNDKIATAVIHPPATRSFSSIALTSTKSPSHAINTGGTANTEIKTNKNSALCLASFTKEEASFYKNRAKTPVESNVESVHPTNTINYQPTTSSITTPKYDNIFTSPAQTSKKNVTIARTQSNPINLCVGNISSTVNDVRFPMNSDGMFNQATHMLRPATLNIPNKYPLINSNQTVTNVTSANTNTNCTITNPPSTSDNPYNRSQLRFGDLPRLSADQIIEGVGCECHESQPGPSQRQQHDYSNEMQLCNELRRPRIISPPLQGTIKVRPTSFLLRPPRLIANPATAVTNIYPNMRTPQIEALNQIRNQILKYIRSQKYANAQLLRWVNLYCTRMMYAPSIQHLLQDLNNLISCLSRLNAGTKTEAIDLLCIRQLVKLYQSLRGKITNSQPILWNKPQQNVTINPLPQIPNTRQERNPNVHQRNLIQLEEPVTPQQNPDVLPLNLTYNKPIENEVGIENTKSEQYRELLELEEQQLIPNIDKFTCGVCLTDYEAGEGVMLHNCLHCYCKECLVNLIRTCEEAQVKCPYRNETDMAPCNEDLLEREVRALVSDQDYEKHLARGLRLAESSMEDAFHCQTPDCPGWCVHDTNVTVFQCPRCGVANCLKCKAIHMNESCGQYQGRIRLEADFGKSKDDQKTKQTIEKMLQKGDAMRCPKCHIVVIKEPGSCDWVKCGSCHTELCWATKGPRWGPRGRGDTSGGCQCKVGGLLCHPRCSNCH